MDAATAVELVETIRFNLSPATMVSGPALTVRGATPGTQSAHAGVELPQTVSPAALGATKEATGNACADGSAEVPFETNGNPAVPGVTPVMRSEERRVGK